MKPRPCNLSWHLALLAGLWLLFAGSGCGPKEQEFTLLLRDKDNRPVAGIEARLAGVDRRLGVSDEKGRITCLLTAAGGNALRLRLTQSDESSEANYDFADAYEIEAAALASGVKTIWLEPSAADSDRLTTRLEVTSEPSGAAVELDGVESGRTPLVLPEVSGGRHEVRVLLSGHQPYAWDVVLVPGESNTLHAPLVPTASARASMQVVSDPPGASVLVDGRPTGRTAPTLLQDLDPGEHKLRLELAGHEPWEGTVRLAAGGQPGTGGGVLRPRGAAAEPPTTPGSASGRSEPAPTISREYLIGTSPGWAEVYLNQESSNRNQAGRFRARLPGGWNTFRVRNSKTGVDVTLRYEVTANDPNTRLILDYSRAQVTASP